MTLKRPELELLPRDWKSDRPKPREPIFGTGWPNAVVYLLCLVLSIGVSYLLRNYLIAPQPAPAAYTWTPEKGLQPR